MIITGQLTKLNANCIRLSGENVPLPVCLINTTTHLWMVYIDKSNLVTGDLVADVWCRVFHSDSVKSRNPRANFWEGLLHIWTTRPGHVPRLRSRLRQRNKMAESAELKVKCNPQITFNTAFIQDLFGNVFRPTCSCDLLLNEAPFRIWFKRALWAVWARLKEQCYCCDDPASCQPANPHSCLLARVKLALFHLN